MTWQKCTTCSGTYPTSQADGSLYFHACAPSGNDTSGKAIERANKRDENITVDAEGKRTGIKAAGLGAAAI